MKDSPVDSGTQRLQKVRRLSASIDCHVHGMEVLWHFGSSQLETVIDLFPHFLRPLLALAVMMGYGQTRERLRWKRILFATDRDL